jgi:hypothetical protein
VPSVDDEGVRRLAGSRCPLVGKRSASVTLTAGRWFFYSATAKRRTFFVVR